MVLDAEFTLTGGTTTPEQQALLCAAHVCDTNSAEFSKLAGEVEDWALLADLAARHGLAPLMHHHLSSLGEGVAPPDIEAYFRDRYNASATWNLFLTTHLLELLEAFESENIRVIPYKGLVVAELYYGSQLARPIGDIDLVVDPKRTDDAIRLLQRLEYDSETRSEWLDFKRAFYHHREFVRRGVPVELHWRLAPWRFRLPLKFDALWERAERVPIAGRIVANFSPEDAMIVLSAHGARHRWERLIWLVDVAQLIHSRPGMNWDTVVDRARTLGSERIVLLSLGLCEKLLSTKTPRRVPDRLPVDGQIPVLISMVEKRLFQTAINPMTRYQRDLFGLVVRERMLDRLRMAVVIGWTPYKHQWQLAHLPRWLRTLVYLLRPIRVMAKHGWKILSRMARLFFRS